MESQKLFPKEIIELSCEAFLARQVRPSQAIYLVLVLSLIILAGILPFLFIEVSVKSPGLLRAATEVNLVKATSAGIVKEVFVRENSKVMKGQLLMEVQSPILEEKKRYLETKVREECQFLKDLYRLTDTKNSGINIISDINTPLYKQALTDHLQKLRERQAQFSKAKSTGKK